MANLLDNVKVVCWVDGKPVSNDAIEQKRLDGRARATVLVLKDLGYDATEDNWSEILTKIGGTDAYWKFFGKFQEYCEKNSIK